MTAGGCKYNCIVYLKVCRSKLFYFIVTDLKTQQYKGTKLSFPHHISMRQVSNSFDSMFQYIYYLKVSSALQLCNFYYPIISSSPLYCCHLPGMPENKISCMRYIYNRLVDLGFNLGSKHGPSTDLLI